jgi:large subunit ribosomal protein L3
MKFTLGIKQNMSQIFDDNGKVHPVTILRAGNLKVTQLKSVEKEGYSAVQVGFGERNEKNISKSVKGHLAGINARFIKEFIIDDTSAFKVGDVIDLSAFVVGDMIEVSAISKGKGFQSVIKRHGFHGGPRSHGQKHSENEPGSISGGVRNGGRVPKGMRMAGRMGGDRVTVKNLKVLGVDQEHNQLVIAGAIPGRKGTLVEIRG